MLLMTAAGYVAEAMVLREGGMIQVDSDESLGATVVKCGSAGGIV